MEQQVRSRIISFIVSNFLFGDESRSPRDDESLLESGILDSTGILELIQFLETDFGIEVADSDTVPDNLGTVANLTRFVLARTADGLPSA
ncbi:MAG: acyl carrier protein [Brooklawnia sp.]|nr:acyl carrier protein [Brooklawnia sp.]